MIFGSNSRDVISQVFVKDGTATVPGITSNSVVTFPADGQLHNSLVGFWVFIPSGGNESWNCYIYIAHEPGTDQFSDGFYINVYKTTEAGICGISASLNDNHVIFADAVMTFNAWHFVAIRFDQLNGTGSVVSDQITIDGNNVDTTIQTHSGTAPTMSAIRILYDPTGTCPNLKLTSMFFASIGTIAEGTEFPGDWWQRSIINDHMPALLGRDLKRITDGLTNYDPYLGSTTLPYVGQYFPGTYVEDSGDATFPYLLDLCTLLNPSNSLFFNIDASITLANELPLREIYRDISNIIVLSDGLAMTGAIVRYGEIDILTNLYGTNHILLNNVLSNTDINARSFSGRILLKDNKEMMLVVERGAYQADDLYVYSINDRRSGVVADNLTRNKKVCFDGNMPFNDGTGDPWIVQYNSGSINFNLTDFFGTDIQARYSAIYLVGDQMRNTDDNYSGALQLTHINKLIVVDPLGPNKNFIVYNQNAIYTSIPTAPEGGQI